MFELTSFQRDLLYVIAELDQPSGQDIKDQITDAVGEVTHGRLYPNLDTLVERGLVNKGSHSRRTNYYDLSEAGREALEDRREWENDHLPFVDGDV